MDPYEDPDDACAAWWLALLLVATLAYAHHSFGTFDLNRNIEIAGTIAGIDFVNPHSWLRVNVKSPNGRVELSL